MANGVVKKSSAGKNILSAVAVAAGGFILLNLTFLLDFLFQSALRAVFKPDTLDSGPGVNVPWLHVLFLLLIGLISWPVYSSKIPVLLKATYTIVPIAVLLATGGILLNQWPAAVWIAGALIIIAILIWLYVKKQHWLYFYAVALTAVVLTLFFALGGEI